MRNTTPWATALRTSKQGVHNNEIGVANFASLELADGGKCEMETKWTGQQEQRGLGMQHIQCEHEHAKNSQYGDLQDEERRYGP